MKPREVLKAVESVEGWLSKDEGEILYHLAKHCPKDKVIVEIGSWKGKSTIWLGQGALEGNKAKIFAIDPHTGSPEHKERLGKVNTFTEFKNNIKKGKVDKIVTPIVKTSVDASKNFDKKVGLLFIDGDHSYEMVKSDFEAWYPKLMNKGVVAFHDSTSWGGVRQLVKEKIFDSNKFRRIKLADSITVAQKVDNASTLEIINNKWVYLIKRIYEIASSIPMPRFMQVAGKKVLQLIR